VRTRAEQAGKKKSESRKRVDSWIPGVLGNVDSVARKSLNCKLLNRELMKNGEN
jgi:hypothetical protein